MTPELWVALIVAIIGAVGGIVASILGVLNRNGLHNIKVEINGRMTEFIQVVGRAGHAEGLALGSADALAIQAMIEAALSKATYTVPPDMLSNAANSAAKALLSGETRVVPGDLKPLPDPPRD